MKPLALLLFAVSLALAALGEKASATHPAFKENLPLARALMRQVNAQEPQYAILEINCRTIGSDAGATIGVIPTECLAIAKNNGGMFCGILYVTVTAPQKALPFTIDHSDAYSCASVARVLKKLRARGLVVVSPAVTAAGKAPKA